MRKQQPGKNPPKKGSRGGNKGSPSKGTSPNLNHSLDSRSLGYVDMDRHFIANLGNAVENSAHRPSIAFREEWPMAGFTHGFGSGGGVTAIASAQVTARAVDINGGSAVAADANFKAITPMALSFERQVWPLLDAMFRARTGENTDVTYKQFVQYIALVTEAYRFAYQAYILRVLTTQFNWSQLFPFGPDAPASLWTYQEGWRVRDREFNDGWIPLMKRLERHILFPAFTEEIKRRLTPTMLADIPGMLHVPFTAHIRPGASDGLVAPVYGGVYTPDATNYGDLLATTLKRYLDHLDAYYPEVLSRIHSYLPYTLGNQNPWGILGTFGNFDLPLEEARFNSSLELRDVFGDTGDPTYAYSLMVSVDYDDSVGVWVTDTYQDSQPRPEFLYRSKHAQAPWSELRNVTMWGLQDQGTLDDNEFVLLSLHQSGAMYIANDLNTDLLTCGRATAVGLTNLAGKYRDFVQNRWFGPSSTWNDGRPSHNRIPVRVPAPMYLDSIRQQALLDYGQPMLRQLYSVAGGSKLRIARRELLAMALGQAVELDK